MLNDPSPQSVARFRWTLLAWIIISLGLRLYFLDNLRWTYDEGIHVLLAQMLARGYTPYSELFVSYPPLYTLSIDWVWQLFHTVESLQVLMSLYTMTGLLAVGLIAWRLGGLWAGPAAAIIVSLEPEFFRGSRGVLTEVPSLSVAALSIAFAAFYLWGDQANKGRGWLIASGIALAASLMLKILSPFVLALIPMMIVVRHLQTHSQSDRVSFWRLVVVDSMIWGMALGVPILAFTFIFDVPALFDQVIRFRFASRGAYEGEVNNFLFMLSFLKANWIISFLAIVGLWYLIGPLFRQGWFVLVWLILAAIFALIQVPLRDKHLPLLLLPLSIMAGLGLGWLIQSAQNIRYQPDYQGFLSALVVLILAVVYLWQTGQVFAGYNNYRLQYLNDSELVLADFIQKFTSPSDCLITDEPTLAFVTDRSVPPNLAEASSARLRSGYLTAEMLIDIATTTDCQIVAPIARRFKRSAPAFVEWSKAHYLGVWLYDGSTEILLAKPITQSPPQQMIQSQFADQVELVGFDLAPASGDNVYLSLYWRPLRPFEQDYSIFVHVRDEQDNTLLSADHQPYDNLVPTSRWPVGSLIKETIRLQIPPDFMPGVYKIYVGMYLFDGTEFARLPVIADTSGENAVIIPNFVVP